MTIIFNKRLVNGVTLKKPHINKKLVCLVFVITSITSSFSYANSDTLYFSVPDFPPFNGFSENKKCTGLNILAMQMVTETLPISLEFFSYPYARILHSLRTGELDIALILKNRKIEDEATYIGPLSFIKIIVITPINKPILRYEDLKQLNKIAVIRNAQFNQKFDQDIALNKVEIDNYTQAISMLKMKRVDGVIGSRIGLEYALRLQGVDTSSLAEALPLGQHELGLHVAKKSPFISLVPLLTSAVERLFQEDLLYRLYQRQIEQCIAKKKHSNAIDKPKAKNEIKIRSH